MVISPRLNGNKKPQPLGYLIVYAYDNLML